MNDPKPLNLIFNRAIVYSYIFFVMLLLCAITTGETAEEPGKCYAELPAIRLCKPIFRTDGSIDYPWKRFYRNRDGSPCKERMQCDHVLYQCREFAGPDDQVEYTVTLEQQQDADVDCKGERLVRRAFVVAGMAGQLRYNKNTCRTGADKKPVGALIIFSGAGGYGFREAIGDVRTGEPSSRDPEGNNSPSDNDYRALEMLGIRVVSIKWEFGVGINDKYGSGWMTRIMGWGHSMIQLLKRPASIISYIGHDRSLTPEGAKFGAAGASGGAMQTASMLIYNVGVFVDYAGFHGGGGHAFSWNHQCLAIKTPIRVNKNTGELCFKGDACNDNFPPDNPMYGGPQFGGIKEWQFVDYIHQGTSCQMHEVNPLHNASSFYFATYDGTIPKKAGFLVNSDPNDPIAPNSDLGSGFVWPTGMLRNALYWRTGVLGEWGNGVGRHGQVTLSGHPSFRLFKTQVLNAFEIVQ